MAELSAATGAKVKVTGLRVGEAKITVSYDDITAEVPVTVTEESEEPEGPKNRRNPRSLSHCSARILMRTMKATLLK